MPDDFYVWGDLEFPSRAAIDAWQRTLIQPAWADWDTLFDGDLPPINEVGTVIAAYSDTTTIIDGIGYFLDLVEEDDILEVRGLVHASGFKRDLLAAFRAMANVGARGDMYFVHSSGEIAYGLSIDPAATEFGNLTEYDADMADELRAEGYERARS